MICRDVGNKVNMKETSHFMVIELYGCPQNEEKWKSIECFVLSSATSPPWERWAERHVSAILVANFTISWLFNTPLTSKSKTIASFTCLSAKSNGNLLGLQIQGRHKKLNRLVAWSGHLGKLSQSPCIGLCKLFCAFQVMSFLMPAK